MLRLMSESKRRDDYYKILGVHPDASLGAIKSRYRELCKQHHPDVGGSQQTMARLNEAYNILADPEKRTYYDRMRRADTAQAVATPRQPAPAPHKSANGTRRRRTPRSTFHSSSPTRRSFNWWRATIWMTAVYAVASATIIYFATAPRTTANQDKSSDAQVDPVIQQAMTSGREKASHVQLNESDPAPADDGATTQVYSRQSSEIPVAETNSAAAPPDTGDDLKTDDTQDTSPHRNIWRRFFSNF